MGSKSGDKSRDKSRDKGRDKSKEKDKKRKSSHDKDKSHDSKSSDKHSKSKSKDKSSKSPKEPKSPKTDRSTIEKKSSRKGSISGPQQEQIDIKALSTNEKTCVHHNIELSFFCESCEEPICRQCTIIGPHNNQLHRINRVEEAFRSRVSRLSETIKNNLLSKRDQLLAQIHRIEYRIEEIRYVKTIIERDARAEYGGILERLKSAEGIKIAVLQHEMSELQKDLDRINDVGHNFNEFTKDANEPIGFLLRSRNLYENIEHLVAKPYKVNIDVVPYDLPRELTEMRLQLQKVHAQKQLIEFKNEVVWKLIEEKKMEESKIRQQMDEAAYMELNQWSQLTDRLQGELQKFQLVCFYCGIGLDETSVNRKCTKNTGPLENDAKGFTNKMPDSKYHGNHRHFFGKPNQDLVDLAHHQQHQQQSNGKNQYSVFVEVQMGRIKKSAQEKEIDLEKVCSEHDKNKNGTLNYIQFKYILSELLELPLQEVEKLIRFFDSQDKKLIQYDQFIEMVNDPTKVSKFMSLESD